MIEILRDFFSSVKLECNSRQAHPNFCCSQKFQPLQQPFKLSQKSRLNVPCSVPGNCDILPVFMTGPLQHTTQMAYIPLLRLEILGSFEHYPCRFIGGANFSLTMHLIGLCAYTSICPFQHHLWREKARASSDLSIWIQGAKKRLKSNYYTVVFVSFMLGLGTQAVVNV